MIHTYKPVKINVSKEDIIYADMHDQKKCVIGRAITRSIPLATDVEVGMEYVWLFDTCSTRWTVSLPLGIIKYIISMLRSPYLTRLFRKPFSFTLWVPDCFIPVEPKREWVDMHQVEEEVISL